MGLTETFDPSEGLSQIFERDLMIGSENLKSQKGYIRSRNSRGRERENVCAIGTYSIQSS